MSLTLKLRSPLTTTLWLAITPQSLAGKSTAEIAKFKLQYGNGATTLGELFTIGGDTKDERLNLSGDLTLANSLGSGMTGGEITVNGPVGHHTGEQMRGGTLRISGSAGDWLGAEMRDGTIRVDSAGRWVGAALPGSTRGMAGGTILIAGSVGHDLGWRMRRGLIAVAGSAGDFVGQQMLAGTILVLGSVGAHPGAGMRRGTLLLPGVSEAQLLPTFLRGNRDRPQFVGLIARELSRQLKTSALSRLGQKDWTMYHGDSLSLGRGEILIFAT